MYNPKLIDQVYYSGLSCRASRFYVIVTIILCYTDLKKIPIL